MDRFVRVALLIAFAFLGAGEAGAAELIGLGFGPGVTFSRGFAVSEDGSAVVGWTGSGPNQQPFRWTRGGGLQVLASGGWGMGVSGDGNKVVIRSPNAVWNATTGLGGAPFSGEPYDMTPDGNVIIGWEYRWRSGQGNTPLLPPPGFDRSLALGVSDDGASVIGRVFQGNLATAARWDASGNATLLAPIADQRESLGEGVSADGTVAVGFARTNAAPGLNRGVRWDASGTPQLLPGFHVAQAANGDGSVVVGHSVFPNHALIWDPVNGTRNLMTVLSSAGADVSGFQQLFDAPDISADGRYIVGFGLNADGQQEAFLAVIPEPAGGGVLICAAAVLRRKLRRGAQACGRAARE